MILYEWDELKAAIDHAKLAIALFRQWGQKDGILIASFFLAHSLYILGDLDGTLDMIGEAKRIASDLTWYQGTITAFEIWLDLVQGEESRESLLRARRWVQESGLSAESELDVDDCNKYIQWARIVITLGSESTISIDGIDSPYVEALRLLARLLQAVEEVGAWRFVIKTLVLQAIALQGAGERDRAQTALLRALTLAEPEGYIRTFVEEGEPVERLLATISHQTPDSHPGLSAASPDYLHRLLTAFSRSEPAPRTVKTLIEPLSERELEVLRLLPGDLSSTEIAQELYISKNTARSHIGHIYDKLGVHSREDAVQRAQELGLL